MTKMWAVCMLALVMSACSVRRYDGGAIGCERTGVPCPDGQTCSDVRSPGVFVCIDVGCGDGITDEYAGEQCDDGNRNELDLCVGCRKATYAPSVVGFGETNALQVNIGYPAVVAASTVNDLFVSSFGTNLISRVNLTVRPPRIGTYAGNGSLVSNPSLGSVPPNEIAAIAIFSMATDTAGNLFIADAQTNVIRRIDAVTGSSTVVAGTGLPLSAQNPGVDPEGTGVLGIIQPIDEPTNVVVDSIGNVYFVDRGLNGQERVQKIDVDTGAMTTLIGSEEHIPFKERLFADDNGFVWILSRTDQAQGTMLLVGGRNDRQRGTEGDLLAHRIVNCPVPRAQQFPSMSRDGSFLVWPSGPDIIRYDIPLNNEAARCSVLATIETPDIGETFDLNATTVSIVDDTVFVADPVNTAIWKIDAFTQGQTPERVAGVQNTGAVSIREVVVSEFVRQTDGKLGVGFTNDCGSESPLEFYAPVADLHRVVLIDCNFTIDIIAGDGTPAAPNGTSIGDRGRAVLAQLNRPSAAARGPSGNIYIADRNNQRIRVLGTDNGRVRCPGEGEGEGEERDHGLPHIGCGFIDSLELDDGVAEHRLQNPTGLAFDTEGNLLIANTDAHVIMSVDKEDGTIETIVGTGRAGYNGDNLPANETDLNQPSSLVFLPFAVLGLDTEGGLLIFTDRGNHRLRATVLQPNMRGVVSTLAGDGTNGGRDDADGLAASFSLPRSVMLGGEEGTEGQLFVVDAIDRLRSVSINTLLQTSVATVSAPSLTDASVGSLSREDGTFATARLRSPSSIALLGQEHLVVADRLTGRLRLVDLANQFVSTITGVPDGLAVDARAVPAIDAQPMSLPTGIVSMSVGAGHQLFVSHQDPPGIRQFTIADINDPASWTTHELAIEVSAGRRSLVDPAGLAVDATQRRLYVADRGAHMVFSLALDDIELIGSAGLQEVAGTVGIPGFRGDGGPATRALLDAPEGVEVFRDTLLVADTGNHRVRRVDADGVITTILGDGNASSGGEGAPGAAFSVHAPRGLVVDDAGNLVVTSTNALRFVEAGLNATPDGNDSVSTIYGKPPRTVFPDDTTRCLADIARDNNGTIWAVDSCVGAILQLQRTTR
jgi:hypothetical protein